METVWIIGAGRFGTSAAKKLSTQCKDRQIVLVDPVLENLLKAKGPNIITEHADGIKFITEHLEPKAEVSWIIPSLPVHLAFEFCRLKIGPDRLVRTSLSSQIDAFLPNPLHGTNQDIYASNANFICPSNCSEPKDACTVTKQHRKQDLFRRLEALHYKDYTPIVLRSRQLGPGIGGYSPAQLFDFLKKVAQHRGPLIVCTACRCHGVITGVKRV
ncbi:MAG: potassium transporter [Proteobacteria bacterium]|nr:potassium transporter [Pseudomonadota bacterium]MBU1584996.1 potassium transporter [Pseudomonadota bacterium]MBU2631642.1 potassium transporter [Pseudomonadota bacterium]